MMASLLTGEGTQRDLGCREVEERHGETLKAWHAVFPKGTLMDSSRKNGIDSGFRRLPGGRDPGSHNYRKMSAKAGDAFRSVDERSTGHRRFPPINHERKKESGSGRGDGGERCRVAPKAWQRMLPTVALMDSQEL